MLSQHISFSFFFLDVRHSNVDWIVCDDDLINVYHLRQTHTHHPMRMYFFYSWIMLFKEHWNLALHWLNMQFFPSLTEINPSQKLCIEFRKVLHQCNMLIQYLSASHDIWQRLVRMAKILLGTLKACRQIPATF